ncbi:alpha/beta hydrolase [Spongiactinospora sp. TRM90649]|uniref:alpha/beta hydrolase n=1 Tax=Spongiactinospora sp. TRM90649 TaxID=3031114 RepID=UPI0023F8C7CB|nr:alpha/beta hydrolase [Spongiactinospora sp. TRM90649]MDF5754564.1 alpha/beta hydrolase [Spongiactinospora sp. TRM90649]
MNYVPVPYDPELEEGLAAFLAAVEVVPLRADTIVRNREHFAELIPPMEVIVGDRPVQWWDVDVPGPEGAPDVTLTVVRPKGGPKPGAAAIYEIHGGGMVLGTRFFGVEGLIQSAIEHGTVGVAVEYRLAPEHPAPAQAEDCYAGLVWTAEHAKELGFDPSRLLVSGFSAGGGLTAAVAIMARDRQGPTVAGLYMGAPMIDDRNTSVSSRQYDGIGAWDRNNNDTAWTAILGERRGSADVLPHEVPARAADLSGLPPAFVEVGAAEVFRDEAVEFATRVWATGGQAELHVWAGGYHGFSGSSDAPVAHAAQAAKLSWLQRILDV